MEQKKNILDKNIKKISTEIDEKYGIYDDIKYLTGKEELKNRKAKKLNIKSRKFKRTYLKYVGVAMVTLATGAVVLVSVFKPHLNSKEKELLEIVNEAEIHGGNKGYLDDEYSGILKNHIESDTCLIKGDGSVEKRLEELCKKEGFSDSVTDAVIAKFQLNYDNNFKEANEIDPLKIYQEEQKQLKEENDNSYNIHR